MPPVTHAAVPTHALLKRKKKLNKQPKANQAPVIPPQPTPGSPGCSQPIAPEEFTDDWDQHIHPLANVFPMISDERLQLLADDIQQNGQRMPILIANDQVIDGRNRLAACIRAGIDPDFNDLGTLDDEKIREVIGSYNLHRRDMSVEERAIAADKLYKESKGDVTREQAATMFGVSRRVVTDVLRRKAGQTVKPKSTKRIEVPVAYAEFCKLLRDFESVADTEKGIDAMKSLTNFRRKAKLAIEQG